MLWPLLVLAIALFALHAVYTQVCVYDQTIYPFKFSIICLGNCFNRVRSALIFFAPGLHYRARL